jgi:hypothetical protein
MKDAKDERKKGTMLRANGSLLEDTDDAAMREKP